MNDNMPQMKPIEMPKINLDLSTTYNMASTVQRQMDGITLKTKVVILQLQA